MIKILREYIENIKEMPLECIKGATLLSKEEVKKLLTQEERMCKGTQEAIRNGLWCDSNGNSNYWLRSAGRRYDYACCVDSGGGVNDTFVFGTYIGLRPALIISNLQSSNFQVGDTFELGDHTFKIISNNLSICDVVIDAQPFNRNEDDENDYETSDVKKYVDRWFNQVMSDYENKQLGYKTDDEIFNDDFDF